MTQDQSPEQGSHDPSAEAADQRPGPDPAQQPTDPAPSSTDPAPQADPYHGPQQPGSYQQPGNYQAPPGSGGYPGAPGPGTYHGVPGPGQHQGPPRPGQQPPPGYPQPGPSQYGPMQPGLMPMPMSDSDARLWSTLSHVGLIVTGFVGPLIIWAVFKDRSRLVRENAAAATNFGFLLTIGYLIGSLLAVTVILALLSPFLLIAVWVLAVVCGILGAMKANNGEIYAYPFNVTWLK